MAKKKIDTTSDIIKRRPNDHDWARVTTLYFQGKTYREIISMMPLVDLTEKKLSRYISKHSLNDKKSEMDKRVIDASLMLVEDAKKKVNSDCIMLFQKGASVIESLLENCAEELKDKTISKGQARATAYNVDLLMSGVTKVQKGLRVAYGMDEDGKLYEKEPEVLVIEGVNMDKI
jgi:hypothetical protein